jgi:hypothetical protein
MPALSLHLASRTSPKRPRLNGTPPASIVTGSERILISRVA